METQTKIKHPGVVGIIQITRSGRGFVSPEDQSISEISIRANETGTALHGDKVRVRVNELPKKRFWSMGKTVRKGLSGSVIAVVERHRTRFVGAVRNTGKGLLFVPDDPRFSR